jgi:hypothetical protein
MDKLHIDFRKTVGVTMRIVKLSGRLDSKELMKRNVLKLRGES